MDSLIRVPLSYYEKFKKARIDPGDILLLAKGASIDRPDSVVMLPPKSERSLANGSIFIVRPDKMKVNPYYLLAVMGSETFLLQKRRGSSNTGALYNDLETIRGFLIPIPDQRIQDYIGVKVEMAERCRSEAQGKKQHALTLFEQSIAWNSEYDQPMRSHWIPPDRLSSRRLDLNFNSPKKTRLYDYFETQDFKTSLLDDLVQISGMIGWKGLTTEYYADEGPWLLRGVEIGDGYLDFDSLVCVQRDKFEEQPQIHLKGGDVAMTKDGTIGKAIVIPNLKKEMAAGSTVARLRLNAINPINSYYLEFTLNHPVLQIQIKSFATGLAQPHITQEWIAKLKVPRIKCESEVGNLISMHHNLMTKSQRLIDEAKFDVEALIESRLDIDGIISGRMRPPTWEDIEK
jgi:type I restriction enzyme, S subunit